MSINNIPLNRQNILSSHNSIVLDKQIGGTIGMDIINDLMNELVPFKSNKNGVCVSIEIDISADSIPNNIIIGHYHSKVKRHPIMKNGVYTLTRVLSYIRSKYIKLMKLSGQQCMPLIIHFDTSQIKKILRDALQKCIVNSLYNNEFDLNPGNKYCESKPIGSLKNKILITGFNNDYFPQKLRPHIRTHVPNMKTLNYAFPYTMKKGVAKINRPYMFRIYPLMIIGYDSKMILTQLIKPGNKINMCALNFQHINAEFVKNIFRKMYNNTF
jgi:hypothetical protein